MEVVQQLTGIKEIKRYSKDRCRGVYVEYEGQTYDLRVYYYAGGYNWFTCKQERGGIWRSLTPIELSYDDDGFMWKKTKAWSGHKELVVPLKRYSAKKLQDADHEYLWTFQTDFRFKQELEAMNAKAKTKN